MRAALAQTLAELANERDDIVLLTADLGFMALEPFSTVHPARFFNVGVSEQNMIGLATGLADAGFRPYAYSIATFAALRPFEFIRNGPVAHRLPVRIAGVGAGFDYGSAGNSHHCLEDIAAFRTQAALTIISPADFQQAASAYRQTVDHAGPIYFRLSKDDKTIVPGLNGGFQLGRAARIRAGDDVLFVTVGGITSEVCRAADALQALGIAAGVLVVSSFNPGPSEDVLDALLRVRHAVTVEEHSISGGLGSFVAEIIAEHGVPVKLTRCGVRGVPPQRTGSQRFLRELCGLTGERLTDTVNNVLAKEAI